jgi:hypothetical protein
MSDGGERDRQMEMKGLKVLLLTVSFGVPLVVLQYFFVGSYPWLYVPFVILIVFYFGCVHRLGGGGRSLLSGLPVSRQSLSGEDPAEGDRGARVVIAGLHRRGRATSPRVRRQTGLFASCRGEPRKGPMKVRERSYASRGEDARYGTQD